MFDPSAPFTAAERHTLDAAMAILESVATRAQVEAFSLPARAGGGGCSASDAGRFSECCQAARYAIQRVGIVAEVHVIRADEQPPPASTDEPEEER